MHLPQHVPTPVPIEPPAHRSAQGGSGRRTFLAQLLAAGSAGLLAGCHGNELSRLHQLVFYGPIDESPAQRKLEEDNRRLYQTKRSRKAMRWLLQNRIQQGMSREDVNHVLGEEGQLEDNSRWLKEGSTLYRVDDELYGYGPDEQGSTIYLAFRDDKLIHFEPGQFAPGVSIPRMPAAGKGKSSDHSGPAKKKKPADDSW